MTDPNRPSTSNQEENAGQRINEALEQTGKRLSEEVNTAGEKVRQFAEERHINEQLEVAGSQVVDRVRQLIDEGNVRRLILRNTEGRVLLEIPLTAGVAVGGAVFWLNPLLAGLGAIAALLARVSIEIVREEPDATMHQLEQKAKDAKDKLTGGSGSMTGGMTGGPTSTGSTGGGSTSGSTGTGGMGSGSSGTGSTGSGSGSTGGGTSGRTGGGSGSTGGGTSGGTGGTSGGSTGGNRP